MMIMFQWCNIWNRFWFLVYASHIGNTFAVRICVLWCCWQLWATSELWGAIQKQRFHPSVLLYNDILGEHLYFQIDYMYLMHYNCLFMFIICEKQPYVIHKNEDTTDAGRYEIFKFELENLLQKHNQPMSLQTIDMVNKTLLLDCMCI